MKFKSKLVSLVLALAMLLGSMGTIGFANTFSDVDSSKSYASAVSLLAALELLKGDGDGTFRPEGDITRAEFATVVVRTLGQDEAAQAAAGQYTFDDVPTDSWASGFISVASTLGIISGYGDGNFGPNDNVTYEQAVKMLVCALGYEPMAYNMAGDNADLVWPGGYLAAASQLNILTGVNGTQGVAAKRWQVARLVYNCLEVDLMEKTMYQNEERYVISNKNILNEYLNLYRSRGEVVANSTASSSGTAGRVRPGEVLIKDSADGNEYLFKDNGIDTKNLIGRSITFYYKRTLDDERTLVYVEDKTAEEDVLVISDIDNIERVSGSFATGVTIEYWAKANDRNTTSIKLAPNPTVMVNGAISNASNPTSLFMPESASGSVELIDSNKSGSYDRVLITLYDTYVVKSVNATDSMISDNYRNNTENPTLTLNMDDTMNEITFVRSNGTSASFSSIQKWAVLSVKQAFVGGRNKIEVIISTETVTGTITGIEDENTIYINEKQYKVSKYYNKYAARDDSNKFKVDDSGKFYLDKDGKIAAFDKTDSGSSYYGFIRGVTLERDILRFSMVSHLGPSLTTLNGASKVRVDGKSIQADVVASALRNVMLDNIGNINIDSSEDYLEGLNNLYVSQLVKYNVNASGQVSSIQTIESDALNKIDLRYDTRDGRKVMKYNSANKQFKSESSSGSGVNSFLIDSNTQVFIVPSDRSKTDSYSKQKGTSYFKDGLEYTVEAYDAAATSLQTASVVVVYVSDTKKQIDATSPVAIYQGHSMASGAPDADYNAKVKVYLTGYGEYTKEIKELWAKPSALSNLSEGDAFRFVETNQGYIDSIEVVLKAKNPNVEIESDRLVTGKIEFEMFGGLLTAAQMDSSAEKTIINIALTNDLSEVESAANELVTISSSVVAFAYNINEPDKLTVLDPAYPFDTLPTAETGEPCRVFVVKIGDVVRSVYFIK